MSDTLHITKLKQREFAGGVQYRRECVGCTFTTMWTADTNVADDLASYHKGEPQKKKGKSK